MNPIYALVISICLQGDECIFERIAYYETLPACMKSAKDVGISHPETDAIFCEDIRYPFGDIDG